MNPFLVTKPRVQRRAELDDSDNKVAESKKKSLDRKKKQKAGSGSEDDPDAFTYLGEDEQPNKATKKKGKAAKKKKNKEGQELDDWGMVVHKPKETPIAKISKVKRKNLKSILATNREELLQLVENDEVDTASSVIYKRMLQALIDVVGHTEDMIHRSKGARGTHQMNLLVNNIRDILIDLQQAQDRGMLAENLCSRFLAPSYLAIGTEILKENEQLFAKIKRESDKDTVDRFSQYFDQQERRLGDFIQDQFVRMREEVKKYLQR